MPSKTFVIGDIHGAYIALLQCLERASFDYQNDHLIVLGDVCDGWPDTKVCIDELLKIKNLTYVLGNHDWWALDWMQGNEPDPSWLLQGGDETIRSYGSKPSGSHTDFLRNALPYFEWEGKLFVHGGIIPSISIKDQDLKTFLWDRNLVQSALLAKAENREQHLSGYEEIFVGHTPISRLGFLHPVKACEIWLMDTGAGWSGVLTIMNLLTYEYFTSDPVPQLYSDHPGRKKF